jgi:hypothetical protein
LSRVVCEGEAGEKSPGEMEKMQQPMTRVQGKALEVVREDDDYDEIFRRR